jgi:hypothetical protein
MRFLAEGVASTALLVAALGLRMVLEGMAKVPVERSRFGRR